MDPPVKHILFVDGLIGSGKSTIIKACKSKYPNLRIVLEPTKKWVESGMLAKFYSNKEKYSCEWQKYVMTTFLDELEESLDHGDQFILVERGHLAAYTVFSYILWQDGNMTDREYDEIRLLHEKYDRDLRLRGYVCDHIFLDTNVKTSMERLHSRNRENETVGVTKEYQQRLLQRFYDLNLTPYSVSEFWKLIDTTMERLDKNEKDSPSDQD